jgi:hypothetical protein
MFELTFEVSSSDLQTHCSVQVIFELAFARPSPDPQSHCSVQVIFEFTFPGPTSDLHSHWQCRGQIRVAFAVTPIFRAELRSAPTLRGRCHILTRSGRGQVIFELSGALALAVSRSDQRCVCSLPARYAPPVQAAGRRHPGLRSARSGEQWLTIKSTRSGLNEDVPCSGSF